MLNVVDIHGALEMSNNMIKYVIGDATEPQGEGLKVIAHICNDAGYWGKGYVNSISDKWEKPEKLYREWFAGELPNAIPFALGKVLLTYIEDNSRISVASMIAQHGIISQYATSSRAVNYGALADCLCILAKTINDANSISRRSLDQYSVHMPRIGAGLGGGDWNIIEELIDFLLVKKGIDVTVYDLED